MDMGCCHQKKESIVMSRNQKIDRVIIHLIGARCGIKILSYSSETDLIQLIKDCILTDSIAMGINEWFAPQISEHWP